MVLLQFWFLLELDPIYTSSNNIIVWMVPEVQTDMENIL